MKKEVRIYELFAGIGSQFYALKKIAKNFQPISLGACEFYIDAIISYMIIHYGELTPETDFTKEEMHNLLKDFTFSSDSKNQVSKNYFLKIREDKLRKIFPYLYSFINMDYFNFKYKNSGERERENFTDIKQITKLPRNIDILKYSFPCQDLSQQGKQRGISPETRSGLLLEVERILKQNKDNLPKVLLLENVKALITKKFINDFEKWIDVLNELGYKSYYKVINSSDYGSAQNRERVFCVSFLGKHKKFEFPAKKETKNNNKLTRILKLSEIEEKTILELDQKIKFSKTKNGIFKAFIPNYTSFNSENYVYLPKGIGPTLTASGANSRLKFYYQNHKKVRYIDEIQSYQYMGFDKKVAKKVKETNLIPKNKMIFTCGNSISVEVLENLFLSILSSINIQKES
ncbi:CpG cytosine-specific DNA modification methyltransferase [Mycoplasmopsis glycophila]|uniref:Cytosine-specific methyltransferase n=2 Tax=Mycoplasmopsis glycophila TaxID=171285 RepID=A0A449AVU2_9BACT|nr:CpG cytosine-specific DNA modification methyltransferase [Mycoplasmopsis glycophila]